MSRGLKAGFAVALVVVMWSGYSMAGGRNTMEKDTIKTSAGDLEITFVGHGTLMFRLGGTVMHVDPVSNEGDYSAMPKADIVLVTHEHPDHLDARAISEVIKDGTILLLPEACAEQLGKGNVMRNGDVHMVGGIRIEAIPAYNVVHKRPSGEPFHPKGRGNGYVITFGDTRVYVAGDTENTPEMKALRDIDVAFLPMNLPYTMDPKMVADAAKAFEPTVLYPYHYGNTDTSELVRLLEGEPVEVRVRQMQ